MKKFIALLALVLSILVISSTSTPAQASWFGDRTNDVTSVAQTGADLVQTGTSIIIDGVEWIWNQAKQVWEMVATASVHAVNWGVEHPLETVLTVAMLATFIPTGGGSAAVEGGILGAGGGVLIVEDLAPVAIDGIPAVADVFGGGVILDSEPIANVVVEDALGIEKTVSLCKDPVDCTIPKDLRDPRVLPKNALDDLLEKQGNKSVTGEPFDMEGPRTKPNSPVIDHILPVSCGGTSDISNLQLLTQAENSAKGDFGHCTQIPVEVLKGAV